MVCCQHKRSKTARYFLHLLQLLHNFHEAIYHTCKISILLHHPFSTSLCQDSKHMQHVSVSFSSWSQSVSPHPSIIFFMVTISVSTHKHSFIVWHSFRNISSEAAILWGLLVTFTFEMCPILFLSSFLCCFLSLFFLVFLAVSSLILSSLLYLACFSPCLLVLSFSYFSSLLILLKCHHWWVVLHKEVIVETQRLS